MSPVNAHWREGVQHAWASLAHDWHELRERASGALTRFVRSGDTDQDDPSGLAPSDGANWGLMAADLRVEDDRIVVRLEVPGMDREDLHIDIDQERLTVSGEKRIERESGEGRYRLLQCAYGSFQRDLALPWPVDAERSQARYRNGVLRIEMPRQASGRGRRITVQGA